ncbi:unnamed protein product [Euphydryas editha]|uniref:Ionotropic receptor 75a N-terminal domain-containing protein n=1 Tax=Euphydryas editha TaxID=104508 RepID=A0AAU9VDG9_EUPED|nr:unnamed protein product [Euphydryas editha]
MDIIRFIISYFASKKLTLLTVFLCWKPESVNKLAQLGQQAGLRLRMHHDFQRLPALPPYRTFREGMLLDTRCDNASLVLEKASENRAFNLRHSWLLIDEAPLNISNLELVLSDIAILPDADVIWVSTDAMVDVYRVKIGEPLVVADLGPRKSQRELEQQWLTLPTAVTRRKDLKNVYLNSATIVNICIMNYKYIK